jgi:hypothetical protein
MGNTAMPFLNWLSRLRYDPLPRLIENNNAAIALFARRDLREEKVRVQNLWQEREASGIVGRQLPNGSWRYPTPRNRASREAYDQYETFKRLGVLVEKFGMDTKHPAILKAAEYFFSRQTSEGDFRGIYDKQYTPNYTAAITELLVKAGFESDSRLDRVFRWLLATRQHDGGWALPFRTQGHKIDVTYTYPTTISPDFSKQSSHMVTGVVLRAFAAHPRYRTLREARKAGELLSTRLFKRDSYADRGDPKYWLQFTFPFCYTDLISSLDTLSLLGFSAQTPPVERVLAWFVKNQSRSGLWNLKVTAGRDKEATLSWLGLAVCRIFRRLYLT